MSPEGIPIQPAAPDEEAEWKLFAEPSRGTGMPIAFVIMAH
jgi:hypothetical protein